MKATSRSSFAALALALGLALGGCATTGGGGAANPHDPLEPFNRSMYSFNDVIDRAVMKPVAQGYEKVVHPLIRDLVGNFFANLGDVWTAANQLLQGKPDRAASDIARFAVNSTFGFFGIADVASEMGLPKHREDFGQTLGVWGVPPGPYLVMPFFGPSTIRDGAAWAGVDFWAYPLNALDSHGQRNNLWALRWVDARAQLLDSEELFEGAALDRYSFMRDAWLQRRRSQVYDGDPPIDEEDVNPYGDYEELPVADAPGVAPPTPTNKAADHPDGAPNKE